MDKLPVFVGAYEVPFGSYVINEITGDIGIVNAKFYMHSGCIDVNVIMPHKRDAEGKPTYGQWPVNKCRFAGYKELEAAGLKNNILDLAEKDPAPQHSDFVLGEHVEVPHLNLKGTVTCISFYWDSATHLEIQPVYNAERGMLPASVSVAEKLVRHADSRPNVPSAASDRPSPLSAPCPSPRFVRLGRNAGAAYIKIVRRNFVVLRITISRGPLLQPLV